MKTLYFDCFAGASGNMILGALVALGVSADDLRAELARLGLPPFEIEIEKRDKSGISAVHVNVVIPDEKAHRHLGQIEKIIGESPLSDAVKSRAMRIFETLAEAEATVHGIDVAKVHFHEVGALDAIIDIVGACIGFEILAVERFVCSKIHVGSGFVTMAHGKFPVPPPAVAELLKNAPIYSTEIAGELITPTGAAIIATVCESFGPMPEMTLQKTAYGAGTRDYDYFPNVLRLMIGESGGDNGESKLLLIETNLDDISAQTLGYAMERAFAAGALDCWFTPIQMKKNRPATMLSILCDCGLKEPMLDILYTETTTLGARVSEVGRDCLSRNLIRVRTRFGEIDVKVAKYKGQVVSAKPEFDQLRMFAEQSGIPLLTVEAEVAEAIRGLEL